MEKNQFKMQSEVQIDRCKLKIKTAKLHTIAQRLTYQRQQQSVSQYQSQNNICQSVSQSVSQTQEKHKQNVKITHQIINQPLTVKQSNQKMDNCYNF